MVIVILVVNSSKEDNRDLKIKEQHSGNQNETSAELQFWNNVLTNDNTVAGFKSYQIKYPNGTYFNEAQKKIDAIEDNQDWETALLANTIAAYREYEQKHSTGKHLMDVKQKIIDIENQQQLDTQEKKRKQLVSDEKAVKNEDIAWNMAKSNNTIASYQGYQKAYPNGRYYSEANKQITAIRDEDNTWEKAKSSNTIASYQSYQRTYPKGRYYEEATKKIAIKGVTKLTIGKEYQGGIIFYIDASGQHGLIAAPYDQSTGIVWANITTTETGATSKEIGSGRRNTDIIVAKLGDGNYAAKLCADLVLNGYSDWFLPSIDELYQIYLNKDKVGGFEYWYWSSTEPEKYMVWVQNFNFRKGDHFEEQFELNKGDKNHVRAVREF